MRGFTVWWDSHDRVSGKEVRKSKRFATIIAAKEFVRRQHEVNPWLPTTSEILEGEAMKRVTGHKERERLNATPKGEESTTTDRDEVERKNRRRMVELMLEHNITISAREIDKWRPTVEKTGRIAGVSDGLKCIMTNGLLGYFVRDGREPLYGHVSHFKWDEPDVSYVPYRKPDGEIGFFKSVKDQGAPRAWARMPRKERRAHKKSKVPVNALAWAQRRIKEMTLK